MTSLTQNSDRVTKFIESSQIESYPHSTVDNAGLQEATVGIVTATQGSTQKMIPFRAGQVGKAGTSSLAISEGWFQQAPVLGLPGLKSIIENIKPNQALTLGSTGSARAQKLMTNEAFKSAGSPDGSVSRNKDFFSWSECHFVLLDHDPEPGKAELEAEPFWSELVRLVPELAPVGRLVTTSSSSGIYNRETGECLKPESGHHTFLQVRGDVSRLVELIKVRSWAKGASFFKLANPNKATGVSATLERHLLDTAVFSPERLVYEAGARFEAGSPLEQRRTPPRLYDGDVLDCDLLSDPTPEERAAAESAKATALEEIRGIQLAKATGAIALAGHKNPKAEAQRRISLAANGKLEPGHVLEMPDGGTLKVSDIAAQHDGLVLRDPQEPTYRNGAAVAILYWNDGDGWVIHSQAHGGCNYTAARAQTKKAWKEAQKRERYQAAYALIAKMTMTNPVIDMSDRKQAKAAFYQPLKKELKFELPAPVETGFATEMMPFEDGRTLLVYDCSQGTGKTNKALIPAAIRAARKGKRVLTVVPTRGLAAELKARINEKAGASFAATHMDSHYASAQVVVTCPESLYKFRGQTFSLFQIDEANEGLKRIESGELGNAGAQSLKVFGELIAKTPVVAMATAAMNGWTLEAAQRHGGFTTAETKIQRMERPTTKMGIHKYSDLYQWLNRIGIAIASDKRVCIPAGSQGKGRMIDRLLRQCFPGKRGFIIDGPNTPETIRKQFLDGPDAYLEAKKPDWFIYTPVINSGVSIDGAHFDIQFEYVTPTEGAQSVSQRGERLRSAIGRDGAITERHIFFSKRGAPSIEAYPEALDWRYWEEAIANEASAPIGAAAALAKALGAEKAIAQAEQKAAEFGAMRPHLSHFLALDAFEAIYKEEILEEWWSSYGWEVTDVEPAEEPGMEKVREQCEKIFIGLDEQEGRTLRKARTRATDRDTDDVTNPFQGVRRKKAWLEKTFGAEYLAEQDDDFYTAWFADKSANNPGVKAVVVSQLVMLAVTHPEQFKDIERMKALKFLAGKPRTGEDFNLPDLPAAPSDIELAGIVARCPGIAAVLSGKITTWTNKSLDVMAARLYLLAHSKAIAANTRRTGLQRGAKFSEMMSATACFNKAIDLVGYRPKKESQQGTGTRLRVYRLENADDVQARFDAVALKKDESSLAYFRAKLANVRAQTRDSINAAALKQILAKACAEKAQVAKATAAVKARTPVYLAESITELVCALPIQTPSPGLAQFSPLD